MAGDKKDNPAEDLEKGLGKEPAHEHKQEIEEVVDNVMLPDELTTEPRSCSIRKDQLRRSLSEPLLSSTLPKYKDIENKHEETKVTKLGEWGTNYVTLATSFLGSVFTGRALLRPHQRPAVARGMLIGIFVVAGLILVLSWVRHAINKLSPANSIWRKNVSKGIEWAKPLLALLLTIAGGVWIGMN